MKHHYITKILIFFSLCLGGEMSFAQTFEQMLPPLPAPQIIPSIKGVSNSSIAFADVDGDGDQDVLVTGSSSEGTISRLYKNDGSGNYTEVTGTPFEGVHTGSIAFADIDGDDDQDVLITGRTGSYKSVSKLYSNDGDGNYTEVTRTPFTGVYRSSIAFADIDADNDQDVLISGYSSNNESISELFENDGDGGFAKITGTPFTGVAYSSVAFADVDNDNDQDVLITGIGSGNRISKLYKNNGDGIYSESTGNSFTGVQTGSIAFADIDGDNDQDVLITGYSTNNVESSKLYLNNGAGNFSEATSYPFEAVQSGSVAFADIDRDGDQDVLITGRNESGNHISKLYENGGSGNFSEATEKSFTGVNYGSIAFADVDGDSNLDVLITGNNSSKLYINDSSGNYSEATGSFFEAVQTGSIAFADVDEDTDQDVLIAGSTSSNLYENDGAGNYILVSGTSFAVVEESSIAFADIDADTDQDVLITGRDASWSPISKLYRNLGGGNYAEVAGAPLTGVLNGSIAFADVDKDGDQDVLITGEKNDDSGMGGPGMGVPSSDLYLNNGAGSYSRVAGAPFTGVSNGSIAFADVDGDGDQDVVITGRSKNGPISKLYSNDGDGNFSEAINSSFTAVDDGSIAFADVDVDGDQDVLITGRTNNGPFSKLYENDGVGNFSEATGNPFEGVESSSIAFADIDGDGDQDVLITGSISYGNNISKLYENGGSGNFTEATGDSFPGVPNGSIAFADVDGDADPDLLITGDGAEASILYRNTNVANTALGDINITSSASSTSEWAISGGVLTATGSVLVNYQVIEDALEAGDLVVSSTRDIFIDADIAPALSGNSSLTLKAVRDIHMETNSAITATGSALNTVLWADSDASDGGMVYLKTQAEILTQGGHLWIGGGSGNATWNGLTVGDGTSIGNTNNSNGITFIDTNIETNGGNIAFYGRGLSGATAGAAIPISTGPETNTNGIRMHDGNYIDAGSGSIYMYGFADNSYATSNANGVELSATVGAGDVITSSNSTEEAIFIEGYAEGPASVANSWGFYTHMSTIQNTGGGTIHIKGSADKNSGVMVAKDGAILADGGRIILEGTAAGGTNPSVQVQGAVGQKAGTAITSSNADIEIIGDRFSINGAVQSSGVLAIHPFTHGTEIGIGSATGSLELPASYFQTNFVDGFSEIIIGDENTGHINIGGSTVYQDPLTLKTDGNILFSADAEVQSVAANALTLWARAGGDNEATDLNYGTIWMRQGSSIHTGGGNLTMGGGSDPSIGYAMGEPFFSDENNSLFRGVAMNGAINAAGGDIIINGKAAISGDVLSARGVNIAGPIETAGDGTISVRGVGKGYSDPIALGDTYFNPDAVGTLETETGDIILDAKPIDRTSTGIDISTAGSFIRTDGNFYATTAGNFSATYGALYIGGNTTLEAVDNITLTHTSNDFGGSITVNGAADLQITDGNELTLGDISISGTMEVATFDGDLTINATISTTNATAAAIRIFADKTKAAGDASGGNIKIGGNPVISTGTGGQARFYSGSVAGSADLIGLTGEENARYEVDANTTEFVPVLGSGIYALIRGEQTSPLMITNPMTYQRLQNITVEETR